MTKQKPSKRFLTPKELSDRWGGFYTVKTLANWRSGRINGNPVDPTSPPYGPRFHKVVNRVLYDLVDVREYEARKSIPPFGGE
jgi:hypothetical protein